MMVCVRETVEISYRPPKPKLKTRFATYIRVEELWCKMLRTLTKFEESVGVCFLFRIPALTLLRSSLVNNRNQAVICDDLGMTSYAVYSNKKADLKTKDRADLLETFLGALYVDKGLNTAKRSSTCVCSPGCKTLS
ncbi:ribonuclease iii [Culex quinquefasciatus]|uniref:Ribonuclease iii n=1 Tax=Culex quinquefasciatus TaxID=7176 RepID=B0WXG9_CULQU|nr:ribonuclease iii [Culex quinquefasciatus]|eukprot:XP_001862091.1 ribonuclease iii [Culex quinquefasciatus]